MSDQVTSPVGWKPGKPHATYVAALDIVGFSKRMGNPDAVFSLRANLVRAIENTPLFQQGRSDNSIWTHFLGDELRIAFLADRTEGKEVIEFAEAVQENLQSSAHEDLVFRTEIVGVILSGYLTPRNWRGCSYLEGVVAHKAQRWMDAKVLQSGEVLVDSDFGSRTDGLRPEWREVRLGSDTGWIYSLGS